MIKITFPNGDVKEFEKGISILEVAKSISSSLGKSCLGGLINNQVYDFRYQLQKDCKLVILTKENKQILEVLRHSMSHIMAIAIKKVRPNATFGVGPSISEGFYYDVECEPNLKEEDLPLIEKEMQKLVNAGLKITKKIIPKKTALTMFKNDKYKLELINDFDDQEISLYYIGDEFFDLCQGPHLQNTGQVKAFKLLRITGSYWKGNVNNPVLQRVYGTAFFTQNDLEEHLKILEERKNSDHRKINKKLELYMNHVLASQGSPTWLPNGFKIRKVLQDYFYQKELEYDHQHVLTPVLGSKQLYITSGHFENYQENMFPLMEMDGEEMVLRPMTCPHHMLIYKSKRRSYRELPLRIAENAILHRYEASGALKGLERVRAMCLTDTHIFVALNQIKDELKHLWKLINEVIDKLNLKISYVELALRGEEGKYHKDDKLWEKSEKIMKEVLDELKVEYTAVEGEAAFYGPKIDFQVKTVMNTTITLSTLQLDFLLPERFDLSYIDENNQKQKPVIIHRGLVGTYERLISILMEQYKGAFPLWLAPTQIAILPVFEKTHLEYAKEVKKLLVKNKLRVTIDDREERLSYKLREAQMKKIPYQIIVGDEEIKNKTINLRKLGSEEQKSYKIEELLQLLNKELAS